MTVILLSWTGRKRRVVKCRNWDDMWLTVRRQYIFKMVLSAAYDTLEQYLGV